jgi:N-glycosylase/DNA lyase
LYPAPSDRAGGASQCWRETLAILTAQGTPQTPAEVERLMTEVLSRPACGRLRNLKRNRVDRLLRSDVPGRLAAQGMKELGREPLVLWHDLASAMRQLPQTKTVAFAMKVFDLTHRVATGNDALFPADVPIVADLRIARISLSSRLLRPSGGRVQDEMADLTKACGFYPGAVRAAVY